MRRLLLANAALAVLLVGHIYDHVSRQPQSAQLDGFANAPGIAGVILVFVSLGVVALRAPYCVEFAAFVGVSTALGFVAIHLLPHWGMFSDPYASRHLDAVSWIEMLASLMGGAMMGWEALKLRRTAVVA
jgi:hypothetical protein